MNCLSRLFCLTLLATLPLGQVAVAFIVQENSAEEQPQDTATNSLIQKLQKLAELTEKASSHVDQLAALRQNATDATKIKDRS